MEVYHPNVNLSLFVESIWRINRVIEDRIVTKIIPDGSSEIIMNYGDSYELSFNGKDFKPFNGIQLFFIRDKIKYLKQGTNSKAIGIRLKPYSLYLLTGIPLSDYSFKISPLSNLLPELGKKLTDISNIFDRLEVLKIVEQLLTDFFLTLAAERDHTAELIYEEIERMKGVTSVAYILEKFKINYKHCERLFAKYYGTTPKKYIRFRRLNFVLNEINKIQNKPDFISIVEKFAFHDQAHFIKEFIDLTGVSPLSLFQENNTLQKIYK
jgi:AraC-like DNA-binding protein